MNIVVCVKYVPDAQSEHTFDASDSTTDRLGVDGLLSALDEYAVEEALEIVEAGGGEVTVVTMGPEPAADAVKKALQMGADKGVHISDDALHGSDSPSSCRPRSSCEPSSREGRKAIHVRGSRPGRPRRRLGP
jgi:electron transfer flavoprotein beta subunit